MDEQPGEVREGRVLAAIPADTFAHRLILVRAHLGHLTVKEAADRTGLNYGSWSNWERGKMPRDIIDVANAIAEGLKVDRDWLLFGGALTPARRVRNVSMSFVRRPARTGDMHVHPESRRQRRPRRIDRPVAA